MANLKRTTRRNRESKEHNTTITLPDGSTKFLWINPVQLNDLVYCTGETGMSLSRVVNNAFDLYNDTEGAVEINWAQRERNQAA